MLPQIDGSLIAIGFLLPSISLTARQEHALRRLGRAALTLVAPAALPLVSIIPFAVIQGVASLRLPSVCLPDAPVARVGCQQGGMGVGPARGELRERHRHDCWASPW